MNEVAMMRKQQMVISYFHMYTEAFEVTLLTTIVLALIMETIHHQFIQPFIPSASFLRND